MPDVITSCSLHNAWPPGVCPADEGDEDVRITEDGEERITEDGQLRIIE